VWWIPQFFQPQFFHLHVISYYLKFHDIVTYAVKILLPGQDKSNKNFLLHTQQLVKVKVKCSHYRPGVAQRVGRGIALLFHDRGTRRGWVVSSTPWPHFTPGKDPVHILQETVWAPGPVWVGGKSRPNQDSIPNRPARSQSLYRLRYPAHYTEQYLLMMSSKPARKR